MDHIELFSDSPATPRSYKPRPFGSEAELRRFVERRLDVALGLRLIASEVPIDGWSAGRIDAIAIDTLNRPVVLEFKREATGTTIGQALAYIDWLLTHRDAVALRVARRLGIATADRVDWSAPHLVCVAETFGQREEAVARQLGSKVALVRIARYSSGLFLLQRL